MNKHQNKQRLIECPGCISMQQNAMTCLSRSYEQMEGRLLFIVLKAKCTMCGKEGCFDAYAKNVIGNEKKLTVVQ